MPGVDALGSVARIRVLLVHAYQPVVEALAIAVGAAPALEVVGARTDPRLVVAELPRSRPDVVVVDYLFDGARLAAALREGCPSLNIVILIPSLDREILFACVEAGAVGYVAKDQPVADLLRAIKRVHAGEVLFALALLLDLLARSRHARQTPEAQQVTQPLARRETQVLQMVATGL